VATAPAIIFGLVPGGHKPFPNLGFSNMCFHHSNGRVTGSCFLYQYRLGLLTIDWIEWPLSCVFFSLLFHLVQSMLITWPKVLGPLPSVIEIVEKVSLLLHRCLHSRGSHQSIRALLDN
jgi:hypothetical protein